ncbi:cytochrome c [Vicingaceae bacterium]|nr:cytochrome c [Vicingaceae bacterium]
MHVLKIEFSCTAIVLAIVAIFISGCSPKAEFRQNAVEILTVERQQRLKPGENFADHHLQDLSDIMTAMFGTPDEPNFLFVDGEQDKAHEIISLENLQLAAGPVKSARDGEHGGLYREHCAQCHGISGGGAGPTAAFLNPYPRDFRLGVFKFKSTKLGRKPTDEDLRRTLVNGIPGTGMPSFRTLPDSEIDSLIDYVKYLSIRGQVELELIGEIGGLSEKQRLVDLNWRRKNSDHDPEDNSNKRFQDELEEYDDSLLFVVEDIFQDKALKGWLRANGSATPVPDPPPAISPDHADHSNLVNLGRTLFAGKANCAQCHGDTGLGDGQTTNLDEWTKRWVNGANVEVNDPDSYQEFLDAGAFAPRMISPRNLRLRVYRGGDRLSDLYRRVANGIEGSGMPDNDIKPEEVWALVAYVRNMPFETMGQTDHRRSK